MVKANTMDELVATWRMPNTWTATSYGYTIKNILTGFTSETYPNIALTAPALTDSNVDQKFEKQVTPSSGSGVWRNPNGLWELPAQALVMHKTVSLTARGLILHVMGPVELATPLKLPSPHQTFDEHKTCPRLSTQASTRWR